MLAIDRKLSPTQGIQLKGTLGLLLIKGRRLQGLHGISIIRIDVIPTATDEITSCRFNCILPVHTLYMRTMALMEKVRMVSIILCIYVD